VLEQQRVDSRRLHEAAERALAITPAIGLH
jgi:hypothetical protein